MGNQFKFLFSAALVAIAATGAAQQDTISSHNLDEVVVTANRIAQKQNTTGKVVTVINQQQIADNAGRTLGELLSTQAGFFINGANNATGTNLEIYFRGASSGKTLIVIDGIPVNDASRIDNSFDLNNISLNQIERIEILKGGQSTIWGSDAMAGVIQIFTKKAAQKPVSLSASYSKGTYKTTNLSGGLNGTIKQVGYQVLFNHTKSAGFSNAYDSTGNLSFDKDGYEQNSLQASLQYKLSNLLTAKLFGHFSTYNNALDAGAFTDDRNYIQKNSNNLGGLTLNYHYKKLSITTTASLQRTKRNFMDDSSKVSSSLESFYQGSFKANTASVESYGTVQLHKRVSLVAGIQYVNNKSTQSTFYTDAFYTAKSELNADSAYTNQASAFASLLINPVDALHVELGGRFNYHSIYGNNGTYTFNPSYQVDEFTKVFLNISSAFKAPSLYQLYDASYGNRKLKPETSTTYEMGVQSSSADKRLSIGLVGFIRDINHLIAFYTDANYNSFYINRDKQHDYGFEIESNLKLSTWGSWSNNYSFITGEGEENGVKVNNLYHRPKFIVNSTLAIKLLKQLSIIPSFKYVGARLKGPYENGPTDMPSYYTIDCNLSYQFFRNSNLFINLHNVTNQQYFDIVGYNSKMFNFMAGINIQL